MQTSEYAEQGKRRGRPRKTAATGTVITRPSKQHGSVYQIRYRINGAPPSYETIGPDRDEADQALALKLAELNRGTHRERRTATFHEFVSSWFADHRARLRPSAAERMRNDLEVHLLPFFGPYMVDQIGAELIERYVREKVEERAAGDERVRLLEAELASAPTGELRNRLRIARRERGLAPVSVNKTLTLLSQVMAAAERYDYIDRNPVPAVKRLKVAKSAKPFLQLDQLRPLLDATGDRHRVLMMTLLLAGLRIGEALALRWRDIELLAEPPRINVARTWDPASKPEGAESRGIEGPVKTGEEGSVTIGQTLLRALLDHKDASAFAGDDQLVFPTSTGGHQFPSNFRIRVLRPVIARANERLTLEGKPPIPVGVTPHSLRHTFCSLLIANGEDLATIAAQMRHADQTTTLKIYTHVMKHRRSGVAERLDEALGDLTPEQNPDGAITRV